MSPLLAARDVVRSFGATRALDGASLALDAGEVVAIMGPSGSGKSTLLHCLAGILPPDAGSVRFDGRELTAMGDRERSALRRRDFGFVFQFGQLVPELDCRENAALPLRLEGVRRREAERRAVAWLERLEVAELARKRPGEISGGEGQRVAVARALADRAARALRRRADGRARLAQRRAGDGAAHGGGARPRRRGRARHARAARRGLRRPRDHRARRAHAGGGARRGGVRGAASRSSSGRP